MSELTAKELYIRQISIPHEIPADNYVAQIPIVQHLMRHTLELHKPVTIFVGENGIGKSTLIEAIAVAMRFNAEEKRRYGMKSLHEQSHGESFMALLENRFEGNGLYILDELEAVLSPMRLMRMMYIMHDLIQRESQFIISTHSPLLMMFPGADILQCTQDGIARVRYQDTEHYQITRMFMDNPDRMFHYLFTEDAQ